MNKIFQAVYFKNWQYDHMNETNRALVFFGAVMGCCILVAFCYLVQLLTKTPGLGDSAYNLVILFVAVAAMFRIPYMQGWLNKYRPEGLQEPESPKVIASHPFAWKIPHLRILGIDNLYASEEEIKKAFRKMAMKYHPDRCTDPRADEYFNTVRQAYQSLIH
jgi:DnaJ domain